MRQDHAIVVLDQTLSIASVSPAAASLLGVTASELVGRPCRTALACCLSPRVLAQECPVRKVLDDGEQAPAPVSTHARSSGLRLSYAAQPLLMADPTDRRVVLLLQPPAPVGEMTGLLSHQLLALPGLDQNLQLALDDLRRFFGSDLAALAFYQQDQREVRWQLASGNLSHKLTDIRLRPGQGFAGRIVASRRPLQTAAFPTDLTRDPRSYPIFLQEELLSALGVPLEAGGRPIGVLMVANRTAHRYSEEDRLVLSGAADVLALAAENLRLFRDASRQATVTERRRLAEEVHDGLSQNLFGLQLLLSDVQQSLNEQNPAAVQAGLREVCHGLDKSLAEVRRLIVRLRGEEVQQPGLVGALCDYLEYFYRMSGLEVELALGLPPGQEISSPHSHEILRIAQEALANVHRHGQAGRVQVELAPEPGGYGLWVRDDGRGFDPSAPQPPGHFGLEIMRERAGRTGGRLEIQSVPGQGTEVAIHFPASD